MSLSSEATNPIAPCLLMGPGPSQVPPSVLQAMARPTLSHLDPRFLKMLDQINEDLRFLFQTKNELTFPVSGTGSAGMEAALANLVEEGDRVLVLINGLFGERMADVAERMGAEVEILRKPWGDAFKAEEVEKKLKATRMAVLAFVLAETSTGVWQTDVEEICRLGQKHGALVLVDAVTALAGMPVKTDAWGIDCCYAATQKAISAPPGLAPITFSEKAVEKMRKRKMKTRSWYLDAGMLRNYFGARRLYHHTAPVNALYGLKAACDEIRAEGLEKRFQRHKNMAQMLQRGLEAMGIALLPEERCRLWTLQAVKMPEGVDTNKVKERLLSRFGIEVGQGLGELKTKILRVGTMGYSARTENILYFLYAFWKTLSEQGFHTTGISFADIEKQTID